MLVDLASCDLLARTCDLGFPPRGFYAKRGIDDLIGDVRGEQNSDRDDRMNDEIFLLGEKWWYEWLELERNCLVKQFAPHDEAGSADPFRKDCQAFIGRQMTGKKTMNSIEDCAGRATSGAYKVHPARI